MSTSSESPAATDTRCPLSVDEQQQLQTVVGRRLDQQPGEYISIGRQQISSKAQLASLLQLLSDQPVLVKSGFNMDARILIKQAEAQNSQSSS